MDMAGNINEWCLDWYKSSYYEKSELHNPAGPEKGAERSTRGGGWSLPPSRCRVSSRWSGSVESDLDDYGFRCALTIK
jgi:formylglycine-generating enzyme required for sulfatase activity